MVRELKELRNVKLWHTIDIFVYIILLCDIVIQFFFCLHFEADLVLSTQFLALVLVLRIMGKQRMERN